MANLSVPITSENLMMIPVDPTMRPKKQWVDGKATDQAVLFENGQPIFTFSAVVWADFTGAGVPVNLGMCRVETLETDLSVLTPRDSLTARGMAEVRIAPKDQFSLRVSIVAPEGLAKGKSDG